MKNMVPNIITLLNLFSGCAGIILAITVDLRLASIMIFISLVLDYMDGTAARLLNAKSPIGKELDSLADVVSFGVLPSVIAFQILSYNDLGIWAFMAFIMACFSAYRLAKFNLDERQTENFIGLPTPANALFWSAFPLVIKGENSLYEELMLSSLMQNSYVVIGLVLVFSFLLVAEIPMFSLKFKNMKWGDNQIRFIFLILTIILIFTLTYYSIPFILILYVLISILQRKKINT